AVQAHAGEGEHGAAVLAFQRATAGFGWSRPGRSALFGNVLYTVIPAADDAVQWVRSLVRELPAEATVLAGIGGPAEATQLPTSRQEADECLALSTGAPVVYDDAWAQVLLHRLAAVAEAGRLPTRGPISNILRYDAEYGTQYAATLRAWLAAQGDVRAAARVLNVHPNTLRYRMQKMAEVTPLPLDDPEQRLAMAIALRITR
ncbi:PucR family transcriptional regulator, partial [Lentzea sp. PSKA42]